MLVVISKVLGKLQYTWPFLEISWLLPTKSLPIHQSSYHLTLYSVSYCQHSKINHKKTDKCLLARVPVSPEHFSNRKNFTAETSGMICIPG